MKEILNKFIDEGKREHEEMRAFIYDFQTTNELLFKERNNSLIELRFRVQELLKVINNVSMIDCDVKGVTTRGGKTATQDVHDNNTNVLPKEPIVVELEKPVESNKVLKKEEAQQKKFLENFRQLHINLPFIEALAQMPKYAKFLEGLLTNKARLEEACKIIMNERCSVVLLNKLPSKEKDPGNFVILDMPEDPRVPIILGRPFLATARAMIDVFNKKITLRVGDDKVIFDVDQSIKRPTTKDDECYGIDDLDDTINKEAQELLANEEPDSFLSRGLEKSIDQLDLEYCESASSDGNNESDPENSIQRIDYANTLYPVTQGTTKCNDVKSEHLYSASANKIDEKKP
ncbi:DNA-directed DNA polymerase [Tanacetum coccineum]|uniref:DNA-directed DNA polymerase n=1 Tax=Tanacetum coccineum TaxID=301880 RepID=A0ABQ5HKZ6_9ASTR